MVSAWHTPLASLPMHSSGLAPLPPHAISLPVAVWIKFVLCPDNTCEICTLQRQAQELASLPLKGYCSSMPLHPLQIWVGLPVTLGQMDNYFLLLLGKFDSQKWE